MGTTRCPGAHGLFGALGDHCRPRHPLHKDGVAWEAGMPLVMEKVEMAPPRAMEVRIKVKYASLCHTDLYFWEAKGQTPVFSCIFGHEAAGIVESIGEAGTDLQAGDHVLPVFTRECGDCAHCKSKESNMCDFQGLTLIEKG